ncbi:unnamed protein product [Linum tenue]|uniref:Aminotransferase-like plant mobile domain-containing protein n=1 Tax=Linum tenue TaxID=586396 RepID=A0AAV0LPF1_9ROSI|nr:unnamed protein product [Linum tenue]
MGNLSWASACLAHLYRSICNASARTVKEIDGAMFIVQFWACEHFPWIAPKIDPDKEWGPDHPLQHETYGCRWLGEKTCDKLGAHKLEEYRRRLDRLWEAELKFDLYPERIVAHHVHKFPLHTGQWCTRVPLICHHVVEWHLPDRCLRQFEREQCLPLEVPESQRGYHGKDGRQGATNWPEEYVELIALWNVRQDQDIVTGSDVGRMGYHDPYMETY